MWTDYIPKNEIQEKITNQTDVFAKKFGAYLGTDENFIDRNGRPRTNSKLNTNQLRKFFGEVKRQQLNGYDESQFMLLKPKLAYAAGRNKDNAKIVDFYKVMTNAIDLVHNEDDFKRFIQIFEAIVAYHKAAEGEIITQ